MPGDNESSPLAQEEPRPPGGASGNNRRESLVVIGDLRGVRSGAMKKKAGEWERTVSRVADDDESSPMSDEGEE